MILVTKVDSDNENDGVCNYYSDFEDDDNEK